MKFIVVAYDKNRGIGANNDLLWQRNLPGDLEHFRELTKGKTVIMGSNTYRSIGRPLPNRQNIVVSFEPLEIPGVTIARGIPEAYELAEHDIAIIGGGSVYEQTIDDAEIIYATEVDATFPQASVFFPRLGANWRETNREHHDADDQNKYAYDFVTYERI